MTEPRTRLGKRLMELRKRIVASGVKLLTWADIDREHHPAREPTKPGIARTKTE